MTILTFLRAEVNPPSWTKFDTQQKTPQFAGCLEHTPATNSPFQHA
jgi:hypothetical protein